MTNVTYNAPEGDNEVVTFMGVKFFNGQAKSLSGEHEALIAKARNNPFFDVSEPKAVKANEPVKCASVVASAHAVCPCCICVTTSAEKVEKVVNPPRKPVMTKSRT